MSDLMNLPGALVRVRFLESFKDGTIFGSKNYRVDEEAEITVDQYNRAKRSGAVMENKGVRLPAPDWGENAPVAGVDPGAPEEDKTVFFVDLPEPAPEPEPEPENKPRGGRKSGKGGKA